MFADAASRRRAQAKNEKPPGWRASGSRVLGLFCFGVLGLGFLFGSFLFGLCGGSQVLGSGVLDFPFCLGLWDFGVLGFVASL